MEHIERKLPFYQAYPMPYLFGNGEEEKAEKRDLNYMKSIYPKTARQVLPYVEEECDRMEYEGSMMYDEYPDRLQLHMMCGRIYDRLQKEGLLQMQAEEEEMTSIEAQYYQEEDDWKFLQDRRGERDCDRDKDCCDRCFTDRDFNRRPYEKDRDCRRKDHNCRSDRYRCHAGCQNCRKDDRLCEIIEVLLYHELLRRRRERRCCRRRFY